MAKPFEDLIAEKAKLNLSIGGRIGAEVTNFGVSSNEERLIPINTSREVAKTIGVSKATYERAAKIRDEGTEEEKQKANNTKRSISSAYRDVVRREKRQLLADKGVPPIPEGQFNVILADPPWEYDAPLRGEPDLHYPTMRTDEICALKVSSSEDAVLFLWTTNPKIEDALKVLHAWGFRYRTNLVWVKDKFGTGFWFRGQHELLLLGVKGNVSPPPEYARRSSVLEAPRGEHSAKPHSVYEIIESYFPGRRYLELFARGSDRQDWQSWGFEVKTPGPDTPSEDKTNSPSGDVKALWSNPMG
jgi:N6-adenosine-specific RNA methylase IME4